MSYLKAYSFILIAGIIASLFSQKGYGGVFNTPHLIPPGEFAAGVEPELIFSQNNSGSGAGMNLRYTQGLTDMNNFSAILGTGTGPRQFRLGGNFTFDFFPDTQSQPGIGLALQGLFVQLPTAGSVEVTATPYVRKNFLVDANEIEPFLALPVGLTLSQGTYQTISTLVLGTLFHHSEHFRSVVEFGIGISNVNPYLSGGIVYYH
jgi:hypothetical protein